MVTKSAFSPNISQLAVAGVNIDMSYQTWVKGNDLRVWADTLQARQKLPALVRRLIHATVDKPTLTQFPSDEGTQRRGWDGIVQTSNGNAWVPTGESVWEMGADQDPKGKADDDYRKRTDKPRNVDIKNTTFVFVTPRKWEGKTKWRDEKRAEGKWRDVIVLDCDDLEQWLEIAPSPDAWLARLLGKFPVGVRDLSSYWTSLSATSNPPLTPAIFLAGREKSKTDLAAALGGPAAEIPVSALSLQELRDFIAATIADADEEPADATAARALIVEDRDAWDQLTTTRNRLILIAGERLQLDKTMIAEAVSAGHHVITQTDYTYLRSGIGVRLPRIDRWELQKAMEAAGFGEERSQRLAREAGGCVSVLVRLSSQFSGQVTPAWAKPEEAAALLPLVLLGAWSDRSQEDRNLVERFTVETYSNVQQLATRWINEPDSPLRFVEGVYSFVSREDSWRLLSPLFTKDLLDHFGRIAVEVLGEDDPRFDMPTEERYLASVRNILPRFSSQMREGIAESIALLGARGDNTPQGAPEGSSWRAAGLVRKLLENVAPKRWFSLAHLLPLLAEAAPDEFLAALERDLRDVSPAVTSLFEKNDDYFFSSHPHASLMWALELLAWDVVHLSRVALILAELIAVDTGGRTHPRPAGVLHDIFRFWYPQTSATIDERLQVLDLLAKRKPEVAWALLRGLVPQGEDTASPGSKPRWREYDSSQIKGITYGDIGRQVDWAADRIVSLASSDIAKWQVLTKEFARLPVATQQATEQWLDAVDPKLLDQNIRIEIWEGLRHLVQEHRFFHAAFWALPPAKVEKLAEIEKKWAPTDPVIRTKWLFGYGGHMEFGDTETSYEAREGMIEKAQLAALREVFEGKGLEGIFELASVASAPHLVGVLAAKAGLIPKWQEIFPDKLLPVGATDSIFALGYAGKRIAIEGDAFVESLPLEDWSDEAVAEFALAIIFDRKTWETLRRRKPGAEVIYWNRVNPHAGHLPVDQAEEAVRCLLNVKRPVVAATCVFSAYYAKTRLDWGLVADAVDAASLDSGKADSDIPVNQHFVWQLCELMGLLQNDPAADRARLVALEYRFLPLARHQNFSPKTLHGELSRNPVFFAELIEAQFITKAESQDKKRTPDPAKAPIAEAARKLMESWTGIPGSRPDGSIDASVLKTWIEDARKLCAASDRIEICDVMIGDQLSCAPPDPDGGWPCEAVRNILESVPTDEVLRGFEIGVANQRGAHWKSMTEGGEKERELARKYAEYANKVKLAWPRTALTLRRIAERYESDAKREDERVEGRD
jgi:hypothetical protein